MNIEMEGFAKNTTFSNLAVKFHSLDFKPFSSKVSTKYTSGPFSWDYSGKQTTRPL